jgi:hypothetical protein
VLREISNVHHGKESYQQACADNQHSERRSIEKPRPRLDRCLDNLSVFFVHEAAPRFRTLCGNTWTLNMFRREEMNWAAPFVTSRTFVCVCCVRFLRPVVDDCPAVAPAILDESAPSSSGECSVDCIPIVLDNPRRTQITHPKHGQELGRSARGSSWRKSRNVLTDIRRRCRSRPELEFQAAPGFRVPASVPHRGSKPMPPNRPLRCARAAMPGSDPHSASGP